MREARRPAWYHAGVADEVAGRFDMISTVLALVLIRLEEDRAHADDCAALTELFIAEMDAQLRQEGVGDLIVGKHMGKLIAVLGGRARALREALGADDATALQGFVTRNITLAPDGQSDAVARELGRLAARLAQTGNAALLCGDLGE